MGRVAIYPSLLAANFGCLADQLTRVENAGADGLHLDVMDGHFVPNITFGPFVIGWLRKISGLTFWAHLMIEEPGRYIPAFHKAGSDGIYVHAQADRDPVDLSKQIKDLGMQAGLAINPEENIAGLTPLFQYFSHFLVMTVHPGFGGQEFMEGPVDHIKFIRKATSDWEDPAHIDVDGGINMKTAPKVIRAGADGLIAGSAIFGQSDPAQALRDIRSVAEEAQDLRP